jgi:hypothetical protein
MFLLRIDHTDFENLREKLHRLSNGHEREVDELPGSQKRHHNKVRSRIIWHLKNLNEPNAMVLRVRLGGQGLAEQFFEYLPFSEEARNNEWVESIASL